MKKGSRIHGTLSLFLLLLAGCAPMAEIDIQVMNPATITLPLHIEKVAFMNRTVYPELIYPDTIQWTAEGLIVLDRISNKSIFDGVREAMDESPLYDLGNVRIVKARRKDTADLLEPMDSGKLQVIKTTHPGDALISLEYYFIQNKVTTWRLYDEDIFRANMELKTSSLWRIYDLVNDTLFDEYVLNDKIEWNSDGASLNAAVDLLPLVVHALKQAGFQLGSKYGSRISPTWKDVPRYYYLKGGSEMRKAARLASAGNWEKAAEKWKALAYFDDERISARASFNMALVCEMEDLLLPAIDWGIKSYSIIQKPLTLEYIEILKTRYREHKRLKRQLPLETQ